MSTDAEDITIYSSSSNIFPERRGWGIAAFEDENCGTLNEVEGVNDIWLCYLINSNVDCDVWVIIMASYYGYDACL